MQSGLGKKSSSSAQFFYTYKGFYVITTSNFECTTSASIKGKPSMESSTARSLARTGEDMSQNFNYLHDSLAKLLSMNNETPQYASSQDYVL